MTKTKRMNLRISAVALISGILLLGALVLPAGFANAGSALASQESRALDDWNGTWLNVGTTLDDPAMDAVYEAMAGAANAAAGADGAFTADDARGFLYAMHKSNFGNLRVAGNTVTYYNVDGTIKCKCKCEGAGAETVAFDGEEFDWYKFELTSGDAACSEYRYLILCEKHSHEGGMLHFHMRYGDTSFDDLINNPAYAMWYPTLGAEGTTVEDVADGYAEGAPMMGYMMLAGLVDPWENFDPGHLGTEIINISGEYICTNEAFYVDAEGGIIPEIPPYQEEGGVWIFEQHGSLLKIILVENGEEMGFCIGSTAGDNIMLFWGDYVEMPGMGMMHFETIWTGKIYGSGEEIVMNAIMRGYDSDNNLVTRWAGTQVLRQGED